jgi:prolyl 4-hydroxylase
MKGYEKRKQPEAVQKLLLDFYRTNRPTLLKPEPERVEPLINDDEVKCGMVTLPDEIREEVADILLPVMEEWAGTRLRMTYLYGIREYYQNNILRLHVDRVDTHIVSVILQIDQDLGDAGPWELELIDFDGIRRNVTLEVGEMMLYESATLIHGRPYPFKGVRFANAFLHYVPYSNWRWRRTSSQTITNGTIEEAVDRFATVNTAKFNQWNVRHKWSDLPYHDEL